MLDPEGRQLLLDALRPPPGYELDLAVGTTYTLDLYALLAAPVAFAMFDHEADDGTPRSDPIAALQALRRHAGKITLFCQAGDISVPRDYRALTVYLEPCVVPVAPPRPDAIFHPKVWFIRYRQAEPAAVHHRLLCMSRNLTFDRSWDTLLRLEGDVDARVHHPELREFVMALPRMAEAVKPMEAARRAAIEHLAGELERVAWVGPEGLDVERFWPLGHDGRPQWPYGERADRIFAMSPFVTAGALQRLTKGVRGSILLSRPETLDQLGTAATSHLRERLVLSANTREPSLDEEDAAGAEPVVPALQGLHAKLVVADVPYGARFWTGSANLTDAAFNGNVEFVTELRGKKAACGVDAIIGDHRTRLGLRRLVEPYEPDTVEGRKPGEQEDLERRLGIARRLLGRLRYVAHCRPGLSGGYDLALSGKGGDELPSILTHLDGLEITVRPVTLGDSAASIVVLDAGGLALSYRVSQEAITPFFAFHLRPVDASVDLACSFLINAELVGAPEDRVESVMVGLLKNRGDLIRFLLLLLGNIDGALEAFSGEGGQSWDRGGAWASGVTSEALLEPIMRAYARDRGRLHEIKQVMDALSRTKLGQEILPAGWDAVWGPIETALGQEVSA